MSEQNTDSPEVSFFEEIDGEGVGELEDSQTDAKKADATDSTKVDSLDEAETPQPKADSELGSQQTEDSKGEIPDKENPEKDQYWQSRFQKAESRFGTAPDKISDELAQLTRTFANHPDQLQEVLEFLTGDRQDAPQGNSPQAETQEVTPPERPQRPTDYNPFDLNDPQSSTFKYEQEYKQYLEDMIAYEQGQRKQFQQSIQEDRQQREQKTKQQQFFQNVKQEAMSVKGYDENVADQFVQFVDRAMNDTFNEDEIFAMFETLHGVNAKDGKAEEQDKIEKKKQELEHKKNLREKYGAPSPGAAGSGSAPNLPKPGEEDSFFQVVEE